MPEKSYILLNNVSRCCGAPIQRHDYLWGGIVPYSDYELICTKCLNALDYESVIYTGPPLDEKSTWKQKLKKQVLQDPNA